MQAQMMKTMLKGKMDKLKPKEDEQPDDCPVDWEDFNYPPFLKIIHFSIESVPDEEMKKWAKVII